MNKEKHHELGPSIYPMLEQCPCFLREQSSGKDASAGKEIHEQVQKAIETGEGPSNDTAIWMASKVRELAGNAKIQCEKYVEGGLYKKDEWGTEVNTLNGIFGRTDAFWIDDEGAPNFADYKSFSDGTKDYFAQLRGYAALWGSYWGHRSAVKLHILHGMIWRCESIETTTEECIQKTVEILTRKGLPVINPFCSFCANASKCPACSRAVSTVGNEVQFSKMSLTQQLVVCENVEAIIKKVKAEARKKCEECDGVLEMDGIRYELVPWGGGSKLRDILETASGCCEKIDTLNKKGEPCTIEGLSKEEFLKLCDLSKTALCGAIYAKNKGDKAITKKSIEEYVEQFFDKKPGTPHFKRTK